MASTGKNEKRIGEMFDEVVTAVTLITSGLAPNTGDNQDATGSPQVSPLTVSSAAKTLVAPTGATHVYLQARSADIRVGMDGATLDGSAGHGYVLLQEGNAIELPIAGAASVYAIRDAAVDAVLDFVFFKRA